MKPKIVDITSDEKYEKFLYKCLAPMPFRKYRKRYKYLKDAIPKGFRKKILIWNNEIVGQIEYAPVDVSGLPIEGCNVFVMNCIWVLRKAKGNNFGKLLLKDVILAVKEKNASGLATIALENHPSPWLKKNQMEKLGFKAIETIELLYKIKHIGHLFKVYLMWLPITDNFNIPSWKPEKLTEGV